MKHSRFLVILAAAVLLSPLPSVADVTIEMKHNGAAQILSIAPHAFQTDLKNGSLIFRGDKKVLWMVDVEDERYTETTEEDAKALGSKLDEAMATIQATLKDASPAKRDMIEKMMKSQMPANAPLERKIRATGEKRTINGFDCSGYLVDRGFGLATEVWAADPKSLHINPKDLSVLKDFGAFMKAMIPGTDQFTELIKDYENPQKDQVPGIPILTIQKDDSGKEKWRSELVRVDKGAIPADRFDVPAGFRKEKAKLDE